MCLIVFNRIFQRLERQQLALIQNPPPFQLSVAFLDLLVLPTLLALSILLLLLLAIMPTLLIVIIL